MHGCRRPPTSSASTTSWSGSRRSLSGGQRQRVAVGRAIVRKPKLFLFDEPLSNLDAKLRVAMRAEISKLHRRLGATIIYVTHDQVEAMTMADRIFIMNKGVVQQSGAPMEVYAKPANRFIAGFIGSPAMNFIDADGGCGRRRPVHRRRRLPGQGARIVPSAAPTVCGPTSRVRRPARGYRGARCVVGRRQRKHGDDAGRSRGNAWLGNIRASDVRRGFHRRPDGRAGNARFASAKR